MSTDFANHFLPQSPTQFDVLTAEFWTPKRLEMIKQRTVYHIRSLNKQIIYYRKFQAHAFQPLLLDESACLFTKMIQQRG